jgi:hypothetical protein
MKLSAKFARQETEQARLARIARRRIREDRIDAVRRMLGLPRKKTSEAISEPSSPLRETSS